MELRETLQIVEILQGIWKRVWLIVLGTLLISVLAFVASRNMTPVYEAVVTMTVDKPFNAPVSFGSISTGENLAMTYSKLLRTRPVLEIAIANLGLDLSADALKRRLGTKLVPDTQLLELSIQDTDPQRAAAIVNETAITFISLRNSEQGLQNITALEGDVIEQMEALKELIENNQRALERLHSAPPGLMEEDPTSIESTLSSQQGAFAGLSAAYLDLRLTQSQFFDISVVEPAIVPVKPVKPNVPLYTFLGVFLGLLFSVGLALVLELFDTAIETRDDVRRTLDLPTLSSIPRFPRKERSSPLVASTYPQSPVSESYRALRTNLRYAGVGKPLKTLLVTGSEPQVGKTSTAANLGVVCAQSGLQVVLVDADLRQSALHRPFGLRKAPGLIDLLVNDIQDVTECLLTTETPNLRLLGSGTVPFNPAELLGSPRMRELLVELGENADLVIMDAPPILAVTDPAVLAPEVDGVLLVVCSGTTRREDAQQALERLQQVGANVIGAVLNGVPMRRSGYYYGYNSQDERWGRAIIRKIRMRLLKVRMPNVRPLLSKER